MKTASDKNKKNCHASLFSQNAKSQSRPLPHSKVFLLNDDRTPMDFVVHVLELFFSVQRIEATRIMLDVHKKGRGLCGSYPHEIAETKAMQVNQYARAHHHPLLCITEKP